MQNLIGLNPSTILEAILDSVGVALAVLDNSGNFVLVNQAALRLFGDYLTKGVSFEQWRRAYRFQDAEGRDVPIEEAALMRALRGEEIEPQYFRVILPNGQPKWIHAAAHHFSVMGMTGVLIIITDETEQVELRRAAERLQRLDAVGQLAGGLAHDFNNILFIVSQHIALGLGDEDVSSMHVRLRHMASAIAKGAALAGKLTQFSRMQEIQIRPVEMNTIVDTVLLLMRPLLLQGTHLKLDLKHNLPMIEADPAAIEQVMVNLMLNALDAMPNGGTLAISTDLAVGDDVTGVKNGTSKRFVVVTVADTGIGLPEHLQAKIFEPFFSTKSSGSGLGLASAYGIVRQHQGNIRVESTPGAGAKFSVYLPVSASKAEH